ncbi:MAG: hypothetical protein U0263_20375 [Polyangiaceae bacterium]
MTPATIPTSNDIYALAQAHTPPADQRAIRELVEALAAGVRQQGHLETLCTATKSPAIMRAFGLESLAIVQEVHMTPSPIFFDSYDQDRHAGNAGDLIKVVVDDAAQALQAFMPDTALTLVDTHAGAGCYALGKATCKLMKHMQGESYFESMGKLLPMLPGAIRIRPESLPQFIGVGAMLLARHKIDRYVAFEQDASALRRLKRTLGALRLLGAGQPQPGCGWQRSVQFLNSSTGDSAPLLVFVDPYGFSNDVDKNGFADLMHMLARRTGPVAVAIFSPGIRVRYNNWSSWLPAEGLIARETPGDWHRDQFFLRRYDPAKSRAKSKKDGRREHFALHLVTNRPFVAALVRAKWNARCGDPAFAAWAWPY